MREAVLLIIGDELLAGHVADANGPFLAGQLRDLGLRVRAVHVLPDDISEISGAVNRELERTDPCLVVTCGGVGPTPDDLTYAAVAEALGRPLVRNERIIEWVNDWCPSVRRSEARSALERMAWVPEGSYLLAEEAVRGPLVCVDGGSEGATTVAMLPGSPELVRRLTDRGLVPHLSDESTFSPVTRELPHEVPEALLGPCFDVVESDHPSVRLGSYPGDPMLLRFEGTEYAVDAAIRAVRPLLNDVADELCSPVEPPAETGDARVERAVRALAEGGLVVVTDDADREDEADLVASAGSITPEQMALLIRHTSGIICVPMDGSQADELRLAAMTSDNSDPHGTAFTVSVDHVSTGTGVSATDRARTARSLADHATRPEELRRPGHVFPLRARSGGVLKRAGHTEATVDLLRLADLEPVGVISELQADDGAMMRGSQVTEFAADHGIPIVAVSDLVRYRRARTHLVQRSGHAALPTRHGVFEAYSYESSDGNEHLALVYGDIDDIEQESVLVRVHSECLTGDVISSLRCDCGHQLHSALNRIASEGQGIVIYLRGHEGRGIGLGHKLQAYALQEAGLDTVAANLRLGLPVDDRDYGIGAQILVDLGVSRIRLMTNNPAKYSGLEGYDLEIVDRVPIPPLVTDENTAYLRAKRDLLGHKLAVNI